MDKSIEISRKYMCDVIKQCDNRKINKKLEFLEKKLVEITKCPENEIYFLRNKLKSFKHTYKKKWASSLFIEQRFLEKNEEWLKGTLVLPTWTLEKPGRPAKEFKDCSTRSKRRKTEQLRSEISHEQLTYAAQMSERSAGNADVAKIIKDVTASPTRATKYRKILNSSAETTNPSTLKLSPTEALAMFVAADLTCNQYNVIRNSNKCIYPCYSLLQRAKEQCYPEDIIITENLAEVKLQNLLDHTTQRLCKYIEDAFTSASEAELKNLQLLCKWGCDGSQQQMFKQKFENSFDSDSNIFQSSLVPLRLISNINGFQKVWWQNPVPSSPRFCRPIRIRFIHEDRDIIQEEVKYIEEQAGNLINTDILTAYGLLQVQYRLMLTMVDAKVCNAITSTNSTMQCYICKQSSKDFNKLKIVKDIDPISLKFGLSILHARIRFFESILHLSYKLPIKKWQARSDKEKEIVRQRKKSIKEKFKIKMGLLVDIPKAGFGNTNDGNTSRRFFSDPETSAEITGIDIKLIQNLKTILEVLSSGYKIDTKKFEEFANDTSNHYVNLYGWHPMSPTLHKILSHGAIIIEHALLPIGQLSEEAAEARNKHLRSYRQNFSRKVSRTQCNEDVIKRLLLSSDPYLSCSTRKSTKKRKTFSKEALEFLLPESIVSSDSEEDDIEDSDQ